MRTLLLSSVLAATLTAVAPMPAATYLAAPADSSLLSEKFTVDGSTAVPGTVLKSGSYVIRVVDHMSDRSILRIEKEDGKVVSTFLAVPNRTLAGSSGPVVWTGGGDKDKALRGYNFPGSFSVEFVYPKAEAVKIATSHSSAVEAIDPPSDNLASAKQKELSSDDMRIVTLWTLSPTRVNGATAIAAAKYKPADNAPEPPSTLVARNEPPASSATPAPSPAPRTTRTASAPAAAASPAAKPARKPVATALPHTASNLPEVLLAGMGALAGIVTLRTRRFTGERRTNS